MGMGLSKLLIMRHCRQKYGKMMISSSLQLGPPSFGQSPLVWSGHIVAILLGFSFKFHWRTSTIAFSLQLAKSGYSGTATLESIWGFPWPWASPIYGNPPFVVPFSEVRREVSDFRTSSFTIVDSPESRRWGETGLPRFHHNFRQRRVTCPSQLGGNRRTVEIKQGDQNRGHTHTLYATACCTHSILDIP